MKLKKGEVDWLKIHAICRRGRQGKMSIEDTDYAEAAFKADRAEYTAVSRKARAEVDAEMNPLGKP